jgi:hypothetical protein
MLGVLIIGLAVESDVTTGPEIASAGAAALLFAGAGALWVAVLQRVMPDPFQRSWAKRWNWGVLAAVAIGGGVAVLVGLICWASGTELGS